ncbi:Aminoacid dehydrogenase-like protein [Cubamyces sp. BRFM 1775]|nr:Aminoacid dehydrogenase-like protein [Cubamyces sp. BRFM 1775]
MKETRRSWGAAARDPGEDSSEEKQCRCAYDQLSTRPAPLRKNTSVQSLKDQNWMLYYGLLSRHVKELIPIIYTPTQVHSSSQTVWTSENLNANYSHLFRRSEDLYLTFPEQGTMQEDFLELTARRDFNSLSSHTRKPSSASAIKVPAYVVLPVTAILGCWECRLQDIGIAHSQVCHLHPFAGMDPSKTLPVVLDVSTDIDNQQLLDDNFYVGRPNKWIRGKAYDQLVDQFVQLVWKHYPHSLLHFEDFGSGMRSACLTSTANSTQSSKTTCKHLPLSLYCPRADPHAHSQGTGASKLSKQRYVVYSAGTQAAWLGITKQLQDSIMVIDKLSRTDANRRFFLLDHHRLVKESLGPAKICNGLHEFVRPDADLLDVVRTVHPTVLIGCSTHRGAFTEAVVKEMAKGCEHPIIFPLSNLSRLVQVLMAMGSLFPPCQMPNGNTFIYSGLGYGTMVTQACTLSDMMIIAGAHCSRTRTARSCPISGTHVR